MGMGTLAAARGVSGVTAERPTGFIGFAAAVIILSLVSWLPVLITRTLGARIGWPVALAVGVGLLAVTKRVPVSAIFGSFLVASALTGTGLVTSVSEYMPVVVTGTALLGRWLLQLVRVRALSATLPRYVLVALAAYVGWALVTSLVSIDVRLSLTYVAGIVVVIAIAFIVAPSMLSHDWDRQGVLGVVIGMAVATAAVDLLFTVTGRVQIVGLPMGGYMSTYIVIAGHNTQLLVPWVVKGIFTFPNPETVVLIAGLVGILAVRSSVSGRAKALASVGGMFLALVLLASQARNAWLMAALGSGSLALAIWWERRTVDLWALVTAGIFGAMLVLVLANVIGSITPSPASHHERSTVAAASTNSNTSTSGNGTATPTPINDTGDSVRSRGGTGLSGRLALWQASAEAVRTRPIFGYGPGTDSIAIAPLLTGEASFRRGLTSHNTWLRTAVEIGVPGLLALIGVLVTVGVAAVRRFSRTGFTSGDLTYATVAAAAVALTAGQFFDTFLLGGVAIHSMYWTVALGMLSFTVRRQPPLQSPVGLNCVTG